MIEFWETLEFYQFHFEVEDFRIGTVEDLNAGCKSC